MDLDLENDAVTMLEQKKQEIIATSGGVYAVKEAISLHTKYVDKVKGELQELVGGGKLSAEVANFVLSYVARSSKVLTSCLDGFKSRYDIKTGEALAYDNVVRKVKEKKRPAPVPAEEIPPVPEVEARPTNEPTTPTFESVLAPAEEPKKKGKVKKKVSPSKEQITPKPESIKTAKVRPDQRGKIGETVDRLKKARKSRENTTE